VNLLPWNVGLESIFAAGGVGLERTETWIGLLIALIALTAMEIVLGIDNIVFISIATNKLPKEQQAQGRLIGLGLAMGFRVLLLFFIASVASWTQPFVSLRDFLPEGVQSAIELSDEMADISVRDLILFGGGLFLIFQSVREIHHLMESSDTLETTSARPTAKFWSVLVQIAVLDIVFSLDSVITAVGMVDNIPIMIAAVMIAVLMMMVFSGPISGFVTRHPSVKVLALSFLLMIGVMLVAEGFGTHFNKNYVYFAMAFSLVVEILNLRIRTKKELAP
jgi:predicted tellurium resistance membrane protein TerC